MRRKVKNAAVRVAAVGFLLGFVSLATAGVIVEDFDSYNDGLLVGQGPWVTADGVNGSAPASSFTEVKTEFGVGNSKAAVFVPGSGSEHVAIPIGRLAVGDQVSGMFQINHSSGYAELWVGDDRHVSGASSADEVSMHMEMGLSSPTTVYVNMYQDSPGSSNSGGVDTVARKGQWGEFRMTFDNVGGETTWGLDTAVVDVRNVSTGSAWQNIGTFPMNTQGIGWDDLYLVVGGAGGSTEGEVTIFDNITVTKIPEPATMGLLAAAGLCLLGIRRRV
jgi:hypothetical protein